MNVKIIVCSWILLGLSMFSFAQNNLEWEYFIGPNEKNNLNAIEQDQNGNLIAITSTQVNGENLHHDIVLTKMNQNGNLIWEQTYGSQADEVGVDLIVTDENEIVVLMTVSDVVNRPDNSQDIQIVKFSKTGTPIWKSIFGGSSIDRGASIVKGLNNDFWIAGSVMSNDFGFEENKGSIDQWVANIDENGELIKSKLFGGADEDFAQKIELLPDGRILLLGHSASVDFYGNYGDFDIILSELSPNLSLNWSKNYGGESMDFAQDLIEKNGDYFIVGRTASTMFDVSNSSGSFDGWIVKVDEFGQLIGEVSLGGEGSEEVAGVELLENGNLTLVGTSGSETILGQTIDNYGVFSIELSDKLNLVESQVTQQKSYIKIADFVVSKNQDLIIGGSAKTNELNSSGWVFSSREINSKTISFKAHPNPSNGELYLNDLQRGDQITIFDLSGAQKASFIQEAGSTKQLNLEVLTSGVYFINLHRNGEKYTARWIKN